MSYARFYQVPEDVTLNCSMFLQRRYLKKYPTAPLHIRLQMTLGVALGLQRMREMTESPEQGHGIVHSALNTFNISIKDNGRAVISGFGRAEVIRDLYENFTGDNSEYQYMGPGMMQDEAKIAHERPIEHYADRAMTALEILTDIPPFGEMTKGPQLVTLLAQRKRPQRSDHPKIEQYNDADELWNLFTECWEEDPVARPTADNVVRRVALILRELGQRRKVVERGKESTSPLENQAGRSDPRTQSGQPLAPVPGQTQLGKPNYPVVVALSLALPVMQFDTLRPVAPKADIIKKQVSSRMFRAARAHLLPVL
ncbi:Serine/threonine-protein kinase [Ceratobasidium sp. AG-Ba]|nr:Serine/threonine-protein kinase [Ceratobasidium sp. AG-Ba]QRW11026.1 Serine/threonine-protein kinase [Ceratobasidium sp. AG-Ba]